MSLMKRSTLIGVVLLILVLAAATIVEKCYDTIFVNHHVYGAWWFVALWGVVAVVAVGYCWSQKLHKRIVPFMLHLSFLIILIGALTSFITSERGMIHIREGKPCDELPFRITLQDFDVEYYNGTDEPSDFISHLSVDGQSRVVAMNKIITHRGYRLYQASYDSDWHGVTLMVNYDPYGTAITYVGYLLLFALMGVMLFRQRGRQRVVNISVIAVTGVSMLVLWLIMCNNWQLQPILRSGWFPVHVSLVSVAYLLFAVMAICGIVGVCYCRSLVKMYRVNRVLVYPALFLLVAGIFVGAIWANVSWGRYWGWDPKEVWALVTMLIYSFALHSRSISSFKSPLFYNLFIVIAFLSILITYFGVNLLGGMHSYS